MKTPSPHRSTPISLRHRAGRTGKTSTSLLEPLEARQLMTSVAWDGGPTGNGTDFNLAANWAGDVLPGAGDDAVLGATGTSPEINIGGAPFVRSISSSRALRLTGTLNISEASSIAALTVFGGEVNTSSSSAVVTITSSLTLSGGQVFGTGSVALASGAIGNVQANFLVRTPLSVGSGASLNVTSGFSINNAGSLSIAAGGVMNLQNANTSSPIAIGTSGSGVVSNAGTIVNTGAGRFNFSVPLNNTGLVQVSQGTIGLINGGTSTGQFDIASGRELTIESFAYAFGTGASTTGPGLLRVPGTLNVSGGVTSTNMLLFGGTVNTSGSSVVTITSSLTFSGGGFLGTGSVALASGAVGTVLGVDLRIPLSVSSNATLNVLGNFGVNNGGSVLIALGGVMNLQNANTSSPIAIGTSGSGVVSNAGTIVNTGAGRFNFSVPLNNTGLVQVSQGTIGLINGGTSTGQFDIASGRELTIDSFAYAFGAGASTTGPGQFRLATTLNVSGGVTSTNMLLFGGTVNTSGSSVVTITSSLTFSGGGFLGTGSVALASGAVGTVLGVDLRIPLSVSSNATLNVLGNFGVNNGGSVLIALGGVMNVTNDSTTSPLSMGSAGGAIANAGTFNKLGAGTFFVNVPVSNTGLLDVQAGRLDLNGGVPSISSSVLNTGAWRTSGGTLAGLIPGFHTIGASASVDLLGAASFPAMTLGTNNGVLIIRGGTQLTTSSVVNHGLIEIAPGARIFASNTFTQSASGTFRTTIAGTSNTSFGWIGATNGSTLNGTLDVRRDPSFVPPVDSSFSVITGNPRSGQFSAVLLPEAFEPFKRFSLAYTNNSAVIRYNYQSGVWTGAAGTSLWSDSGNWSNNVLPGATDDVFIPSTAPGVGTIADGPSWNVRSITSEKYLTVDTALTTSAPSHMQVGTWMWLNNSASLNGSDWNFVTGPVFVLSADVSITGGNIRTSVILSASSGGMAPRLTLSGTARPNSILLNAAGAQLDLADGYHLDTGVRSLSNGPAGARSVNFLGPVGMVASGGAITDASLSNSDELVINANTLINSGTIRSEQNLRISATDFQNLGLITTSYVNNTLTADTSFTNQSGTVRLAPSSNLIIAGDFNAAPGMGTWDSTGGLVTVTGTVRDAVFALTSNFGFWALDQNGVLDDCDIFPVDTALESYGVGGTLLDTDYNGTLIVSGGNFVLRGKTHVNAVNVIGSGVLTLFDTVVDYPIVVGGAASGAASAFTIRFQTSDTSPLRVTTSGAIIYQSTPGTATLSLVGVGGSVSVELDGTLHMQDPNAALNVSSSVLLRSESNSLIKAERGTLSIANTLNIDASGSLAGAGTWEVGDGVLDTPGKSVRSIKEDVEIVISGSGSWSQLTNVSRNDGTLTILAPLTIAPEGASFGNYGSIRIGPAGSLNMGANFAMDAGSSLIIEAQSASQAGRVNAFSAYFGDFTNVVVNAVGGYEPQRFDDITVLTTTNGIIGSPGSVSLPSLSNPDVKPILIDDGTSFRFVVTSVADLDNDGEVGFGDFLNFFNYYDSGDPGADLDGDAEVGFGDFLLFFNLYDAG